jgi:phosphatidate cytidylyltransferase
VTVTVAAIVSAVAATELAGLSARLGGPVSPLFLGLAAAVVCVAFVVGDASLPAPRVGALAAVLVTVVLAAGAVTLASGPPDAAAFQRAAVSLMGPAYVGLPLGALATIRVGYGARAFTLLFLLLAVSDSAQYYTGRYAGRRKLAPAVSPAKTVEGAAGGLLAAAILGAVLGPRWLPGLAPLAGALVGMTVAAVGIIGDLFESLLKRSAGVKDSSGLIPGHGGVLDRIDSYLFAAPLYYLFLRYLA